MNHEKNRRVLRDTPRSARIARSFALLDRGNDRTHDIVSIKETKPIQWQEYCHNKSLPKLLTVQDLIKHRVNKEDDTKELYERPLLIIKRKKIPFTPASAYAFGRSMIKGFLP